MKCPRYDSDQIDNVGDSEIAICLSCDYGWIPYPKVYVVVEYILSKDGYTNGFEVFSSRENAQYYIDNYLRNCSADSQFEIVESFLDNPEMGD